MRSQSERSSAAVPPLLASYPDVQRSYETRTPTSKRLYEAATNDLPGGETRTSTFFLPHPVFMARGRAQRLYDRDDNVYLDFLGNYTSLVHGHAHPTITDAITTQLARGTAHGACTEAQNRLAASIKGRMPSIERVRFANSGTEAVMQAVRTARAFTGRPLLVKMAGGYHGSWDGVMIGAKGSGGLASPGLSKAIAEETLLTRFNDPARAVDLLSRHGDDIAAVLVEPMLGAAGAIPATREFLDALRGATTEAGALLIFDEIQTFRLAYGGAQQEYEIRPDLTVFGKVIGGGLPIGAWGGRADAMDLYDPRGETPMTHPGTFNGNALSMVAGAVALELLTPEAVRQINGLGERLRAGLKDLGHGSVCVTGMGSFAQLHFCRGPVNDQESAAQGDRARRGAAHLALINEGVFTSPHCRFAVSTPMEEGDVDQAVAAVEAALAAVPPTA